MRHIKPDKRTNAVMEDYEVLKVTTIQSEHSINMSACKLWRMNLCAVSKELPCTFYVAMNFKIKVYVLDTDCSPFKDPVKTLISPTALGFEADIDSPFIINALKVDKMLDKEVLVSVSESGEVCIWKTENLNEQPMILKNHASTWGIAIHGEQGLLAVSANNWKVTVFNVLELTKENPIYGKRDISNHLGTTIMAQLVGHDHNIPGVDFDESGKYIASASIDGTCKIWDVTTQSVVTEKVCCKNPDQEHWCWSAKFVKPGYFKRVVCIDKAINKEFIQRFNQGKYTSSTNLGLRSSAKNPSYPMITTYLGSVDFDLIDDQDESETDESSENDESQQRLASLHDDIPFIEARGTLDLPLDDSQLQPPIPFRRSSIEERSRSSNWTIVNPVVRQVDEDGEGWGEISTPESSASAESHWMLKMVELMKEKEKAKKESLGQYVMVTTGKNFILTDTVIPYVNRVRAGHGVISRADSRSDQLLNVLDRINMVEWLPELELFVMASQKGTVALIRMLQVEFEGGIQACLFNTEHYLPNVVFQATPLYGMTVKRIEGERFSSPAYQIYLFYYDGSILAYTVSRDDTNVLIEDMIL